MKKYEALYDWPMAQIAVLADSDATEQYVSTLSDEAIDDFVAITEKLRSQSVLLHEAKASRKHSTVWLELRGVVDSFAENFANFDEALISKLRLVLLLCNAIADLEPELDVGDLDEALLAQYSVSPTLPGVWFTRQSGASLDRSLVFLKPSEIAGIQEALRAESASAQLLFHVVASLSLSGHSLPEAMAILKSGVADHKDVESFVKLNLLMDGHLIHVPKTVTRNPAIADRDVVDVGNAYAQWAELLWVLSEYNSRRELLLKFLTLYQAFESLMFKLPIVELERSRNGAMFSLREFKALYSSINVNEQAALENLFKSVFLLPIGSTTIRGMVEANWSAAVGVIGLQGVTDELALLGVKFGASFTGGNCAANFSRLIYVLRNSVVHNKETEFHLTSESLSQTISELLEEFVLPTLESIVFGLISSRNDKVWYANQKLMLY